MQLPHCDYRHIVQGAKNRFFCRHTQVHSRDHLVNLEVCLVCQSRNSPCPELRVPPERIVFTERSTPWLKYITTENLMRDTRRLLAKLPDNISGVVGLARSGMLPACVIAAMLHLPLFDLSRQYGVRALGCGTRLSTRSGGSYESGPLLVVDDSVNTGEQMYKARRIMAEAFPNQSVLYAAIYPRPETAKCVDLFAHGAPSPHLFEWNLFNCNLTQNIAFDLDGVICEDWRGNEEDEASYLQFIRQAQLLRPPRRSAAPLIVTARLEKYRDLTQAWLERHGVWVRRLVMGPWKSLAERRRKYDAGAFKGEEYAQSDCWLFVESDPRQAEAIFQHSGKPVLCITTGRIYQ